MTDSLQKWEREHPLLDIAGVWAIGLALGVVLLLPWLS